MTVVYIRLGPGHLWKWKIARSPPDKNYVSLTHLGSESHVCGAKNKVHPHGDACVRHKSLLYTFRSLVKFLKNRLNLPICHKFLRNAAVAVYGYARFLIHISFIIHYGMLAMKHDACWWKNDFTSDDRTLQMAERQYINIGRSDKL